MIIEHISEKPWSDYTAADYSLEQWHAACLIHQHDGPPTSKNQCKLPVKTPSGAVNRNGVHAAAAALAGARGGVNASSEEKASAARALIRLYSQLGEDPPPSLKGATHMAFVIDETMYIEHFGVKGMRWGQRRAMRRDTRRGIKEARKQINTERDVKIDKARQKFKSGEAKTKLKDAKAAVKADKGSVEARKILDEVRMQNWQDAQVANLAKSGREKTTAILVGVGLITIGALQFGASINRIRR